MQAALAGLLGEQRPDDFTDLPPIRSSAHLGHQDAHHLPHLLRFGLGPSGRALGAYAVEAKAVEIGWVVCILGGDSSLQGVCR